MGLSKIFQSMSLHKCLARLTPGRSRRTSLPTDRHSGEVNTNVVCCKRGFSRMFAFNSNDLLQVANIYDIPINKTFVVYIKIIDYVIHHVTDSGVNRLSIHSTGDHQGVLIVVLYKVGPRWGESVYHSLPICRLPKYDSTLEVPPHLPGLGRRGGGPSPSARAVWADWLEWMGRKTAQAVINRISSVLSNLGNRQMGREW